MDPDGSYYQLCFLVMLIFLSAFFTLLNNAFNTLSKYTLKNLVGQLKVKSFLFEKLDEEPRLLLYSIIIYNSFFSSSTIVYGTMLMVNSWQNMQGLFVVMLLIVLGFVIIGNMLTRKIAFQDPERISGSLLKVLYFLTMLIYPLVKVFNSLNKSYSQNLLNNNNSVCSSLTEEEIIDLVATGEENGSIPQEERTLIHGVFEFDDTIAKDVMVPRPDIVAVEKDTTFAELLNIIKEEKFSRIPVYEDNIDNILGIVHIKDLMISFTQDKEFTLLDYLRQPFFVPETKKVNELFEAMKKEKVHMAIVLDEYGSTAGLVTIEDLIEEIMGDIQDEHDVEEPQLRRIDAETVEVNASLKIDDLNEQLGLELECEEADTVGGLVFTELDRVPLEGDKVVLSEIEFSVKEMDGHRIEKVVLTRASEPENYLQHAKVS